MLYTPIFLLLIFLPANLACSCVLLSEEDDFNQAEIVARVTILEKAFESISNTHYKIRYNQIFKPRETIDFSVLLPKEIATGANSALCGLELDKGEEYLVAGIQEDGRLFVQSCSVLNRKWFDVDPALMFNLRNGFSKRNA